jgi:UDP-N-acetylglucosamine--N-acetylmuramyl-(pentapeptide) pyrophosphoryl-undecaprenol N-acetylglucosamine transferase
VYPALAVLQEIQNPDSGLEVAAEAEHLAVSDQVGRLHVGELLWIGGIGGMEAELVKRSGIPFEAIPSAGVHGVGLRSLPGNLRELYRGFRQARRILHRFKPEVMFFTGGYVAVPVALAGWLPQKAQKHPRSLLYVPDIEPGLALKTLASLADFITVTVEETKKYLPSRKPVRVTGYPMRPELKTWGHKEAFTRLGLRADLPTLLVLGGSKGARSINRALLPALPELLKQMQVVHLSGQLDWAEVLEARERLAGSISIDNLERYRAYPYLHEEMGAAFTVADLVVCRAGASVLGELPYFGIPAILVPYPYAWRYQQVNAQYLTQRGAAIVLPDGELSSELAPSILRLMRDHSALLKMQTAMKGAAQPQAAQAIADQLRLLAEDSRR